MKEHKTLEYKETINSNTFLKTVSAYANYGGGRIIFGISDDGKITGIANPEDACLSIEHKINDNIKPSPDFTLGITINNTVILDVEEGLDKPYFYKGKAYKRNDTSTLEVARFELKRLILEGENRTFEELESTSQDLTFKSLEKTFHETLNIKNINDDILKTLGFYTSDKKFNIAAALLSDHNTFKGVDIIKFGDDIDEIMDRITLENMSVISELTETVEVYKKYYQYEKIQGMTRNLIEKVPEDAFREAIANALVHRSWDINAFIRISMFHDRIEITSPGGLPSGINEKEYLNGQISILKNPIIGNVFYRLHYIETFGTGIFKIKKAYESFLIKPQFKIYENSITIVLPVDMQLHLTKSEHEVFTILKKNIKMSRRQLELDTNFSKDKVIRTLNSLIEKAVIEKSGQARSVKYNLRK